MAFLLRIWIKSMVGILHHGGCQHVERDINLTMPKPQLLRNGLGIWTCWWSDWAFILWCPSRWEDMSSFFSSSIRKWFWMAEPICQSRCDCRGPRCKANELDRLLHADFGSNPHLSSALTSILIPFFDIRIQQLVLFSSWQLCNLSLSLSLSCFSCNTSTHNDPVSFSHKPNGLLSILSC